MIRHGVLFASAAVAVLAAHPAAAGRRPFPTPLAAVQMNDNTQPGGQRWGDTLVLKLRAASGIWHPEGTGGPALEVEAFGEQWGPLQVPAPLIRVPEGTEIVASVRNDLTMPLRVHGLCARDGSPCAPIELPAGGQCEVRFKSGRPGTYHYWATTTGMPQGFRGASDTQLSGAFVVDPRNAPAFPDRVFIITEWTSLTVEQLQALGKADDVGVAFLALKPKFTFMINGRSWPDTERLTYRVGDEVRWRVINLTTQAHPMHLHGFYFSVDANGDGLRDTPVDADRRQQVVTHLLAPGATMAMTWRPEREGNWLFHCHVMDHVSPARRLTAGTDAHAGHHAEGDRSSGMAAMILGITVTGSGKAAAAPAADPAPSRTLTLVMQSEPGRYGGEPAFGFALAGADGAMPAAISVPGPTLVLRRGEPVEITLVNRLAEATAIHWHGLELESFYDGVHGWSGAGSRVTPMIEPGASFVVRLTPPRAGTFIYHTHLHDDRQLPSGMYGALLVLEPGDTFDEAVDHVVVLGRGGQAKDAAVVLNGSRDPRLVWQAGVRHRIRLINITPNDILVASLVRGDTPVEWKPIAKDGAPVPGAGSALRPATQTIAVGETYDFEYQAPPGRQTLWINVRTAAGRWSVQARVVAK